VIEADVTKPLDFAGSTNAQKKATRFIFSYVNRLPTDFDTQGVGQLKALCI
jgi:hypothetical protein